MSHPTQRTIWQYATGELAVGRRQTVREHATDCETCNSKMRRAIAATRTLCGRSERAPTPAELETWGRELLTRRAETTRSQSRRHVVAFAGATAAAALLLALPGSQTSEEELVSRGGQARAQINLRVLCVSAKTSVEIEDATSGCAVGSFLKILIGNNASSHRRMAVFQIADGTVEPVYPADFGDSPFWLPESTEPMPGSKVVPETTDDALRIVAFALDDTGLDADDPLLSWAKTAQPGHYHDLFGRTDAVVVAIDLMGDNP